MPEFIPQHTPTCDLDAFTRGYLECAEWLLDDDDRERCRHGWHPEAIDAAKADCERFQRENADALGEYFDETDHRGEDHAGHDFWLTRNHHGAGFWDRGDALCFDRLTDAAEAFGSVDAYVGDDGFLYFTP